MPISLLQAGLTAAERPVGPNLWQYLFVSSAMVGAVVFLGWILRRYVARGLRSRASGRSLQVLDALPLGGRAKLAVVRVYDRTFVVGMGEKEVNLVAELDRVPEAAPVGAPSIAAGSMTGARGGSGLLGTFERLRTRVAEARPGQAGERRTEDGAGAAPRPATAALPAQKTPRTKVSLGGGHGLLG